MSENSSKAFFIKSAFQFISAEQSEDNSIKFKQGQNLEFVVDFLSKVELERVECILEICDASDGLVVYSLSSSKLSVFLKNLHSGIHCLHFMIPTVFPVGTYVANFKLFEFLDSKSVSLDNFFIACEFSIYNSDTELVSAVPSVAYRYFDFKEYNKFLVSSADKPSSISTKKLPLYLDVKNKLFKTLIGELSQYGINSFDKSGVLLYGPYLPIEAGEYEVFFDIVSSKKIKNVTIDAVADKGRKILSQKKLNAKMHEETTISFSVPSGGLLDIEFRIKLDDAQCCEVRGVAIFSKSQSTLLSNLRIKNSGKNNNLSHLNKVLISNNFRNIGNYSILCVEYASDFIKSENLCSKLSAYLRDDCIVVAEDSLGIEKKEFYFRGKRVSINLILFLDGNFFTWRSCLFALAENLHHNDEILSFFVYPDSLGFKETPDENSVLGGIVLSELIQGFHDLPFSVIYTHGFGYLDNTKKILDAFPLAKHSIYGDGFKNGYYNISNVEELVVFGWKNYPPYYNTRLLNDDCINDAILKLNKNLKLPGKPISADVMICLRYYGVGSYKLSWDQVCLLMWNTVSPVLQTGDRIVVKPDVRAKSLTKYIIEFFRERHHGSVLELSEYIGEFAEKPLEWLFSTDCLSKIRDFVVFDSSLSWMLVHAPNVRADVRVLLGANLDSIASIDESNDKNVLIDNIVTWTYMYANALEHDGFNVCRLSHASYIASRSDLTYIKNNIKIPEQPSMPPCPRETEEWWMKRHDELCRSVAENDFQIRWYGDSLTQNMEKHQDVVKKYLQYSLLNAGVSGDKTANLLWRLKNGEEKGMNPDAVVIWIGAQDILGISPISSSEQIFTNIRCVCTEVDQLFPESKKILFAILPIHECFSFPCRKLIKEVNFYLNDYAAENGWFFFDQSQKFVDKNGYLNMSYMSDSQHLNALGYEVLLKEFGEFVDDFFQKRVVMSHR